MLDEGFQVELDGLERAQPRCFTVALILGRSQYVFFVVLGQLEKLHPVSVHDPRTMILQFSSQLSSHFLCVRFTLGEPHHIAPLAAFINEGNPRVHLPVANTIMFFPFCSHASSLLLVPHSVPHASVTLNERKTTKSNIQRHLNA